MEKSSSSGGIGFSGFLTIVFIVLKLCHVIDWSWWWVLSPTIIPLALAGLFICVLLAVLAVGLVLDMVSNRKR